MEPTSSTPLSIPANPVPLFLDASTVTLPPSVASVYPPIISQQLFPVQNAHKIVRNAKERISTVLLVTMDTTFQSTPVTHVH
jgi:hypothetical protein